MTAQPTVSDAINDGLIAPIWSCYFEKWYLDGQTPDGDFFFLYLAPMTLLGHRSAEFVCCLYPHGGGEEQARTSFKGGQLEIADDRCGVRFPGGHLQLGDEQTTFEIERDDMAARLSYEPMDPAWIPTEGGTLLKRGKDHLRWVVPMPRGRLTGTLRVGDTTLELQGHGYSDYVQSNIFPTRLPLRELLWGRAISEDLLVVWNRPGFASPEGRTHVSRVLVRQGDGEAQRLEDVPTELLDWIDHPRTEDRYPSRVTMTAPAGPIEVDRTRLLLGEFVADVQPYSTALERWFYRKVAGNPVEYKLLSQATMGEPGPTPAWAAHEWVLFGPRDQVEG